MDKLDEYIEHYEMLSTEYERSKSLTEQFTQLANWLKELKELRILIGGEDNYLTEPPEQADVQPAKRGKWLQHGKPDDYFWCCSACKKWIIYAEHDLHKHHFCGNCGADMRGESGG